MSGIGRYLDCGCYLPPEGGRAWCPTCSGDSRRPVTAPPLKADVVSLDEVRRLAEKATGRKISTSALQVALMIARTERLVIVRPAPEGYNRLTAAGAITWETEP